jgi:hypothetical protein
MTANLWNQPGIPHKGWYCVGVEDLEEASATCEMCGKERIRYVHGMEHPEGFNLDVGCICAGKMTGDYEGARLREYQLRKKARRLETWRDRQWSRSAAGNVFIKTEGLVVVVHRFGEGWRVRVKDAASKKAKAGNKLFPTIDAAKLAALDAVMWAKEQWK